MGTDATSTGRWARVLAAVRASAAWTSMEAAVWQALPGRVQARRPSAARRK